MQHVTEDSVERSTSRSGPTVPRLGRGPGHTGRQNGHGADGRQSTGPCRRCWLAWSACM